MTTLVHEYQDYDYHHTQETQWETRVWKPIIAGVAMLVTPVLFLILIVGGILFWMPHISFAHSQTNQSELQIAQNGIATMRKMVGNNEAWSQAIKQEYDRLYSH